MQRLRQAQASSGHNDQHNLSRKRILKEEQAKSPERGSQQQLGGLRNKEGLSGEAHQVLAQALAQTKLRPTAVALNRQPSERNSDDSRAALGHSRSATPPSVPTPIAAAMADTEVLNARLAAQYQQSITDIDRTNGPFNSHTRL